MSEQLRKYAAEVAGTAVFIGFALGSVVAAKLTETPLQAAVPLAFGLALLAGLYLVGEISGGHYNPAVSLAMFLDRRMTLTDMIAYWIAQTIGALLGASFVAIMTSRLWVADTMTNPGAGVSDGEAFFGEVILTAAFVWVILQVTKSKKLNTQAFIAISLTLAAVHFVGVPLTGPSVNPVRSLAPAIVGDFRLPIVDNSRLWIYLLAPLVGAAIAWILYRVINVGDINVADPEETEPAQV